MGGRSEAPGVGAAYRFEPAPGAPDGGEGGKPVTVLVLHGAGGDEESLLALARRVAPGAALLSPRGSLEAADGGFRHLPPRDAGGRYDADAVGRRADELATFVGAACDTLGLDPSALWAFGFSDGAGAVTALALRHPEVLAGGVLVSGRAPLPGPGGRILDGTRFFCAQGRSDDVVTLDDYEELVEALVTAGAEVELHWYDRGHEISDADVHDARAWLARWTGPSEP